MKKQEYIPKLYAACKYMKDNKEDFEGLIYDFKLSNEVEVSTMHNELISPFNFLIGKRKEPNKNLAKGSEITLSIDLENIEIMKY